jgi:hypothetical protein
MSSACWWQVEGKNVSIWCWSVSWIHIYSVLDIYKEMNKIKLKKVKKQIVTEFKCRFNTKSRSFFYND